MQPSLWQSAESSELNAPDSSISTSPAPPASRRYRPPAPPVPTQLPAWALAQQQATTAKLESMSARSMQPTEWRGLARNLAPELLEVSFVMETSITENSAINPDRITSKVLSVPASSHSVHTPTPIRPKHKLPDEAVALPWQGVSTTAASQWNVQPSPPPRRRGSPPRAQQPAAELQATVAGLVASPSLIPPTKPEEKKARRVLNPPQALPLALSNLVGQDLNVAPSPSPPKRRKRMAGAKENEATDRENEDCGEGNTARIAPCAVMFDGLFSLSPLSTLSITS